MEAESK